MKRMLRMIKQRIGVPCYMTAIRTFCYQLNVVLTISVHILNALCSLNDVETILTSCHVKKIRVYQVLES